MFILRRLTSLNVERNTVLGESYMLIDRERNPEAFEESIKAMKWVSCPDTYGFISYNEGQKLEPLYKDSTYFVMTSNGQTFANISLK